MKNERGEGGRKRRGRKGKRRGNVRATNLRCSPPCAGSTLHYGLVYETTGAGLEAGPDCSCICALWIGGDEEGVLKLDWSLAATLHEKKGAGEREKWVRRRRIEGRTKVIGALGEKKRAY